MKRIFNECCDCATEYYRCLGRSCPNRHVEHFFCDMCREEDQLYYFDGKELCRYCLEELLESMGEDTENIEDEYDVVEGSEQD